MPAAEVKSSAADEPYTLEQFVTELRSTVTNAEGESALLARVGALAKRIALSKAWMTPKCYRADPVRGIGCHVLHEEPDHSLFVAVVCWLPGRGAPPHNHGTWGVIVGVEGEEKHTFWVRTDDHSKPGHADIQRNGSTFCRPGDLLVIPTGKIHSVVNESDKIVLSFHVYGRHLNHTGRSQFDPEAHTEQPFIINTQ